MNSPKFSNLKPWFLFLALNLFFYFGFCLNSFAQDSHEQSPAQTLSEPQETAVQPEGENIPKLPTSERVYAINVLIRDILTENDCKYLIDLNQSISLIEKYYKERSYSKAKNLITIVLDDIARINKLAAERLLEKLQQGQKFKNFKELYRTIKIRRFPSTCEYHNLKDIENVTLAYDKKVENAIFKQEARLLDKELEEKMRLHIEKAIMLLEDKRYYEGRRELRKALELCRDFETEKVIKQRLREVDQAIDYEKRLRARQKKQK